LSKASLQAQYFAQLSANSVNTNSTATGFANLNLNLTTNTLSLQLWHTSSSCVNKIYIRSVDDIEMILWNTIFEK
jgi:hypothetical protein